MLTGIIKDAETIRADWMLIAGRMSDMERELRRLAVAVERLTASDQATERG